MANIQVLMNEIEKNEFGKIADELGFQQSQLALLLLHSLVELYKKRGQATFVGLELPNYGVNRTRDKRVQIVCSEELKLEVSKMSNELGYSQAQLCLIAIHSFVNHYNANGTTLFSEILNNNFNAINYEADFSNVSYLHEHNVQYNEKGVDNIQKSNKSVEGYLKMYIDALKDEIVQCQNQVEHFGDYEQFHPLKLESVKLQEKYYEGHLNSKKKTLEVLESILKLDS